ncbi:MAG: flippase-like domain-containing protein [Marinilabiliaceae bacterium]|nr:flippase-like domain-containing protein [Marinilabiliaceae bacterium]
MQGEVDNINKVVTSESKESVLDSIKSWKIVIPIVIGIGVTIWMLLSEYEPGSFNVIKFSASTLLWFFVAMIMMATRDVGYMMRIRILSDKDLSWRQSFRIIMLWEFASAVTPSAVGGTSVAVFFVNREGIHIGRATGIVMVTSFLDELFFALVFPLVVFTIGYVNVFGLDEGLAAGFARLAWIGYSVKLAYIILLSYGLFVNPHGFKWLLEKIFSLPYINRWRDKVSSVGDDIITTSINFQNWPFKRWVKAFVATSASWIARYWVANALIVAFFGITQLSLFDHFIVFGKQLAMWIMMLVAPTPGGAGFAEYIFKEFLSAFIPLGTGVALALAWRMVSYYPYLIIGAILVPKWVSKIKVKRGK